MNILFVDSQYPMFDRASADVRMFAMVRLLREQGHDCHYYVSDIGSAESRLGAEEVARYRDALRQLGVSTLERKGFEQVLAEQAYDLVFFKYFYPAEARITLVRIWQPQARVVVDSVDLVYARLRAKADVSGLAADRAEAEQIMARELATYAVADLVITVTEDEARILGGELPGIPVHVIPNIHDIHVAARSETPFPSLLFIGTFTHEPNVDGVLWFTREVWPSVHAAHPGTRLRIVGGNPPPAIQALSGNGIEVTGYVPDTLPFLMESWISVAPLRFGAGMKGKVGEAMAAGLPVVTTSFGAEGFGLVPGVHLLVADDPVKFAETVSTLITDRDLRSKLGGAGHAFIESRYSPAAVGHQLTSLTERLTEIVPRQVTFAQLQRLVKRLALWGERKLFWRLRKMHLTK
jgi:glycosyltransferase involved in cell wall biosynthesis